MTRQIMKLCIPYNSAWKIIMDDSEKNNKFKVYRIADGHTRLIKKYGDVVSCLHCITQQLTGHEWYMSDRKVDRLF